MKRLLLILSVLLFSSSFSFAQWDSLKGGIKGHVTYGYSEFFSEIIYNGNLYIGGVFDTLDDKAAMGLGEWSGTSWNAFSKLNTWGDVEAFAIYNGNLYAGGQFTSIDGTPANNIAVWNGTSWSALGTGFDYRVCAMAVYNGNLYVGGVGQGFSPVNIAMWNGTSWSNLGRGVFTYKRPGAVFGMAVYKGNLYVGGKFDSAGTVAANNLAIWNGSAWSALAAGINDSTIGALKVFNNELYVGGFLGSYSNSKGVIDKWDGTTWSSLGTGLATTYGNSLAKIYAMTVYDSAVCVAGLFDSIGGIQATDIAYWDGSKWGSLDGGIAGGMNGGLALVSENTTLYVGGTITIAGSTPVNCIAQWSGPLAVNNISSSNDNIKVFPNPSNGVFQLRVKNYELGGTVKIYNMLGQEVASSNSSEGAEFKSLPSGGLGWAIDISNQPSGIYLYRVTNSEGALVGSGKLVIN